MFYVGWLWLCTLAVHLVPDSSHHSRCIWFITLRTMGGHLQRCNRALLWLMAVEKDCQVPALSTWRVPSVHGIRDFYIHIEGILPKGPYLPCVSMAGRALLAGYHRHMEIPDSIFGEWWKLYYMAHEPTTTMRHCDNVLNRQSPTDGFT